MRVDPAIAALRRDRAPQRRAQAVMVAACDAWRASPEVRRVLAELERYGAGAPLAGCAALHALFTDRDSARNWVGALVRQFCSALARAPFGHPPLRHGFEGGSGTLLLARSGRAQLWLHAREPGHRAFASVTLRHATRCEAVLGGEAQARTIRRIAPPNRFEEQPLALRSGMCLALDLAREVLQVLDVKHRLVSLRLDRAAVRPRPTREYAIDDGALLHQSAGDIRSSRHEAMLALLGRMGRAEAVPVLAAIAIEQGADWLRWQALRECLALDTAAGFRTLCAVARTPGDSLSGPAETMRAKLAEEHPPLIALEATPCPA